MIKFSSYNSSSTYSLYCYNCYLRLLKLVFPHDKTSNLQMLQNFIPKHYIILLQITNSVRHTSLACLASRVVRAHGLDTSVLPSTLQNFVAGH